MTIREIVGKLNLQVKAGASGLDNELTGGYASDLLSDVLANSSEGNIWITLQIHPNIVAVASVMELSGIVLVNGREPARETVLKAEQEDIPIVGSALPAYELIGRLYELGISGSEG